MQSLLLRVVVDDLGRLVEEAPPDALRHWPDAPASALSLRIEASGLLSLGAAGLLDRGGGAVA